MSQSSHTIAAVMPAAHDPAVAGELSDLLHFTPNIPPDQLRVAASELGLTHLGVVNELGRLPMPLTSCAGVMVGVVTLSRTDKSVHISAVCVIKTGSLNSYLAHDAIRLLNLDPTAQEYRVLCQGEEHTFRRRSIPEATSIIGLNFINQHKLLYGGGRGFMYDNREDVPADFLSALM